MPSPAGVKAPAERQADGGVVGQHLGGEQLARLAQPAGVVREEGFLDQRGSGICPVSAGGSIRLWLIWCR